MDPRWTVFPLFFSVLSMTWGEWQASNGKQTRALRLWTQPTALRCRAEPLPPGTAPFSSPFTTIALRKNLHLFTAHKQCRADITIWLCIPRARQSHQEPFVGRECRRPEFGSTCHVNGFEEVYTLLTVRELQSQLNLLQICLLWMIGITKLGFSVEQWACSCSVGTKQPIISETC